MDRGTPLGACERRDSLAARLRAAQREEGSYGEDLKLLQEFAKSTCATVNGTQHEAEYGSRFTVFKARELHLLQVQVADMAN